MMARTFQEDKAVDGLKDLIKEYLILIKQYALVKKKDKKRVYQQLEKQIDSFGEEEIRIAWETIERIANQKERLLIQLLLAKRFQNYQK